MKYIVLVTLVFTCNAYSKSEVAVSGEIVVKFRQSIKSAQQGLRSQVQIGALRVFKTDDTMAMIRLRNSDTQAVIAELNRDPDVLYAEPNYIYRINKKPNDWSFKKAWTLSNVGQRDESGQYGKPGSDINVAPVWAMGYRGSRNIKVAIIDTGIDWNHPDLRKNLFTNPGESGKLASNGIDDDSNGFIDDVHGYNFATHDNDTRDDHNHGSHCAGIIGAVGNNWRGVSGVNWEVTLLPVKAFDNKGNGTLETAVESINYARQMKVHIMSNSWGNEEGARALKDAIAEARNAGILFVVAAGNDSRQHESDPTFPTDYDLDNIISVAATDNLDQMAFYSNWSLDKVHIAAPGTSVYSTIRNGKYKSYQGTSMAAPHVAGAAALLLSIHPEWSYQEIKKRLIEGSTPIGNLRRKIMSRGRLNVFNALMGIKSNFVEPNPRLWTNVSAYAESPHPYSVKQEFKYVFHYPGAKYLRLHFSQIGTERFYDTIRVLDRYGDVIEQIWGAHENYFTDFIEGDMATVIFKTDFSQNFWGFAIDGAQIIQ